jgi:hypothetical protein
MREKVFAKFSALSLFTSALCGKKITANEI